MSAETHRASNDASAPPALVYVIEDDADVARLVLTALRDFGFACEVFATGGAVLRRLQFEKPDLCIVDLGLPDMDGLDLMRRIAAASSAGVLRLAAHGSAIIALYVLALRHGLRLRPSDLRLGTPPSARGTSRAR